MAGNLMKQVILRLLDNGLLQGPNVFHDVRFFFAY